jgi:hypothetical protein
VSHGLSELVLGVAGQLVCVLEEQVNGYPDQRVVGQGLGAVDSARASRRRSWARASTWSPRSRASLRVRYGSCSS